VSRGSWVGGRGLAQRLGIQLRFLPRATPKLNAMDHLGRHVKGRALADRKTRSIERGFSQPHNSC
jgi:hypothetical protein